MKLSDSEKRDIVRLIESGKNLPEKYRFLLFEDSRKVEIFWEDKSLFVPTENIPFQIIENIDEPRTENFKNIQSSFEFASGKKISGWTNKLIWGDNREIIASLNKGPLRSEIEDQGGVKLIYIDPPFNTGNDSFNYNDKFNHSTWLTFMHNRLIEAKKFLKKISIKTNKKNFESYLLSKIGIKLYENFYKNYTIKQWGVNPNLINSSVAKRIPIRFDKNKEYIVAKYKCMPKKGFTHMFKNMLSHKNITIKLNKKYYFKHSDLKKYN